MRATVGRSPLDRRMWRRRRALLAASAFLGFLVAFPWVLGLYVTRQREAMEYAVALQEASLPVPGVVHAERAALPASQTPAGPGRMVPGASEGVWGGAPVTDINWGTPERVALKEYMPGDLAREYSDDARSRVAMADSASPGVNPRKAGAQYASIASVSQPKVLRTSQAGPAALAPRGMYDFESHTATQLVRHDSKEALIEESRPRVVSAAPNSEAALRASLIARGESARGSSLTVGQEGLTVGTLSIGDASVRQMTIANASADITVSQRLRFTDGGTLEAAPDSTIHMTGSIFENQATDPAALAGLANLRLIFEGGKKDLDPFEVAGKDFGPTLAGFVNNFALGTLEIGGADIGQVRLVDLVNNQGASGSEALYVRNLIVGAGSYLDLNGVNLYYLNGTFADGAIIDRGTANLAAAPEPATLAMLVMGFGGVLSVGWRKHRGWGRRG